MFAGICFIVWIHLYCHGRVLSPTCAPMMTDSPSVWQRGGGSVPQSCHTVTHELSLSLEHLHPVLTLWILIPYIPMSIYNTVVSLRNHLNMRTPSCFHSWPKINWSSPLLFSDTVIKMAHLSVLFSIFTPNHPATSAYGRGRIQPQGNTSRKDKWDWCSNTSTSTVSRYYISGATPMWLGQHRNELAVISQAAHTITRCSEMMNGTTGCFQ